MSDMAAISSDPIGERPPIPKMAITAAFVVGAVALMILALQPILLGALVQDHVITDADLGGVATVETLTLALASAVSPQLMARGHIRLKVAGAAALLLLVDLFTGRATGPGAVMAFRAMAGLLEGAMLGATILTMLQGVRPERLNALFLALSAIPQALGAFLLPTVILPKAGAGGGFAALGVTAAVALASAAFIALPKKDAAAPDTPPLRWTPSIGLALFAIFLQNAGIGAAWNYVERIANDRGFSAADVAVGASGNIILQVIGALLVAWIGGRIPFKRALVIGALLQAGVVAVLAAGRTAEAYILGCLAFGFLWLAMSPFQLRLLIDLDKTRSAAAWSVALTLLGLSAGPLAGALGVAKNDVSGAFWIAATLMLGASACYAICGAGLLRPARSLPALT